MRLMDAWHFRQRPYGTANDGRGGEALDAGPDRPKPRRGWLPWKGNRGGAGGSAGDGGGGGLGDAGGAGPDDSADVVHETLKSVDVWFGYAVHELEQEAKELAEEHAAVGQPRHDLERDGPLEMELLLENRGAGVLHQWITRVRRKLQGAIEAETERVGGSLAAARQAIDSAEATRDELASRPGTVPPLQIFPAEPPTRGDAPVPAPDAVECERYLGGLAFWTLMVLLVAADFLANAPLFTELFPANRAVDEALAAWEERALMDGGLLSFGPLHLLVRLSAYMEATLLALSVVVFFVFLGHITGAKSRTLVALRRYRRSGSALADASRQALLPVVLSIVGICCTVAVLYLARGHVEPMARARVEQVEGELARASALYESALTEPDDLAGIARARSEVGRLEEELVYRAARHDYARSVQAMNLPIMGLNIVLVIAAIVAGFLHMKKRYVIDPRVAAADADRRRAAELRAKVALRSRAAHDAVQQAGRGMARIAHLLNCDVTSDWRGKARRVQEAISLFRIENARLRHLDVTDIAAFHTPFEMRLPTPQDAGFRLEPPAALPGYAEEYARLREALDTVSIQEPDPRRGPSVHTEGTHG